MTAALSGLTITGGSALAGGGLENSGTITLTDCTISGNSASSFGGGLWRRRHGDAHRLYDQRQLRHLRRRRECLRPSDAHRLHGQRQFGRLRRRRLPPEQPRLPDDDRRHDRRGQRRNHQPRPLRDGRPGPGLQPDRRRGRRQRVHRRRRPGGHRRQPHRSVAGPAGRLRRADPDHGPPPGSPAIGKGVALPGITTDQRGFALDSPRPDIGAFQSIPWSSTRPATGPARCPAISTFGRRSTWPTSSVAPRRSPSTRPSSRRTQTIALTGRPARAERHRRAGDDRPARPPA